MDIIGRLSRQQFAIFKCMDQLADLFSQHMKQLMERVNNLGQKNFKAMHKLGYSHMGFGTVSFLAALTGAPNEAHTILQSVSNTTNTFLQADQTKKQQNLDLDKNARIPEIRSREQGMEQTKTRTGEVFKGICDLIANSAVYH